MGGRETSGKGALAEKHLGLLWQVEGRVQAKGQDIWKVRGCWAGLEEGLWASCCRECVWFMPVAPAQGRVRSRYSVDAELITEQGLGGS